MTTWDLLICSIEHRTASLTALLEALAPQIIPGVGVRIFRDNLEHGWTAKCQALIESSRADYVSYIDDDDLVAPDFVERIMFALEFRPDYVGFMVRYTEDGVKQVPVLHGLQHDGWHNTPEALFRDITDKNPIRRELALLSLWEGGNGADRVWADRLRALGVVKQQVFIPAELYYYQHTTADTFTAHREPLTEHPPRPEFSCATYL